MPLRRVQCCAQGAHRLRALGYGQRQAELVGKQPLETGVVLQRFDECLNARLELARLLLGIVAFEHQNRDAGVH
jgi:hypothetical protein